MHIILYVIVFATVLLLSLWKHGTDYEPRINASPALVLTPA